MDLDFGQNKEQSEVEPATIQELAGKVARLGEISTKKADLAAQTKSLNGEKATLEREVIATLEANSLRDFNGETHKVFFKNQTSVKVVDTAMFRKSIGEEQWDALAKIDSKTAQTFFKQQKDLAEDEGDYNYQLNGVEYKEFTQLGMRKK